MIKLKSLLTESLRDSGVFVVYANPLLNESAGTFDLAIVQKIGGLNITQDSVDKITSLSPGSLTAGSKNTYDPNKKEWSLADLKKALAKEGQLVITTAGSVTKVRSQYGECICQLGKDVKQNTDRHLARVHTILKLLQLGAGS